MEKIKKTWIKVLLGIVGTLAGLLLVLQLVLSSAVLTKIVNKVADKYIEADVNFGKASVNLFKRFPAVCLHLEDFAITYPTERYDSLSKSGIQGHLLQAGRGESVDTLAYFKTFSASINPWYLLNSKIKLPYITLDSPRIFAHNYGDGQANWNVFNFGEETPEDADTSATESGLPAISIGNLAVEGKPRIVYTDSRNAVFANVSLKHLNFRGRITPDNLYRTRLGLHLDSMFVAGRVGRDTLAFAMDTLQIRTRKQQTTLRAKANSWVGLKQNGRMRLPIDLRAAVSIEKDSIPNISLDSLKADLGVIGLSGYANALIHKDSIELGGHIGIDDCLMEPLLQNYAKNFIAEAGKIKTDAVVSMLLDVAGVYAPAYGRYPDLIAVIDLPESQISHSDFDESIRLKLKAEADMKSDGTLKVDLEDAKLKMQGLDFQAKGNIDNLSANDPSVKLDASLRASIDELSRFVPDSLNLFAKGQMDATLKGRIRMSQMNPYQFGNSAMEGKLNVNKLKINYPPAGIDAHIGKLSMRLAPEVSKMRRDPKKTFRMLALSGNIDTLGLVYADALTANGKDIVLTARNSTLQKNATDTSMVFPISLVISAKELKVRDSDNEEVKLDQTANMVGVFPSRENKKMPLITVGSKNKHIYLNDRTNRAILTDASFNIRAVSNKDKRSVQRKAMLDSLAQVYPTTPRDSLFRVAMAHRSARNMTIPDWMSEKDFRKNDIDIRLDKSLAKYFREWNLNGGIDVRTGVLMTPYFPLLNIIRGFKVNFDNDKVAVDSVKFRSGKSEIGAKGEVSGLRRALLGRGIINMNLDIFSDRVNANELLKAYVAGSNFTPPSSTDGVQEASNAEFLKQVTTDVAELDDSQNVETIIVLPGNINARLNLHARNITYSELEITEMTSKIIVKERCAQLTNTTAISNVGDLEFDGFYASKTKKDLKAGFNLNMKEITAEKVIGLLPQIDTLMPMLKSFEGRLNCEMAATTALDTNMNFIMPSINGVLRIKGNDLTIKDSDFFRTLAKKLMFKNKKEGHVKEMSVEAMIANNKVEIFPFSLKIDRYTLAASGIQNLDMSYRYHLSVIKSPIPFRVGVDIYGKDFDHMKFKIGKAKYKNANVPVFSALIDESKINLVASIRNIFEKGVDAVMQQDNTKLIDEHKETIKYENVAEKEMEELSAEDHARLKSEEDALTAKDRKEELLDSLKVRADSLGISLDSLLVRNDSIKVVLDSLSVNEKLIEDNNE
ncbi:MAG: hypothetical protein ACI3ZQ_10440 [Candidatus Cryptobacteroides sp.]